MDMSLNDPSYPDAKRQTVFAEGIEFQDFVCIKLAEENIILQNMASKKYQYAIGENLQGWEIKLDNLCTQTNRLSIEIAEKSKADNPVWVNSGIYRNDNSWLYIQGNMNVIFIFAKKILVGLHKSKKYEEAEIPTLRKFYLPMQDAKKYCAKYIELGIIGIK